MKSNTKILMSMLAVVFLIFIYYYNTQAKHSVISNDGELTLDNNMDEGNDEQVLEQTHDVSDVEPSPTTGLSGEFRDENQDDELKDPYNDAENLYKSTCSEKNQLTPDDLLPNDNSSEWAQLNPTGVGSLKDRNFLQSGHHIGINTVGQSLRNANLQLRSEPPNPQVKVSPFLQSTIGPDMNRKPFEIGGC